MRKSYILLFLIIIQICSIANTGIIFKENKNQWPKNVLFGADYKTTKFFVNDDGFNFCIYDGNDLHKSSEAQHGQKVDENGTYLDNKQRVKGHNYKVVFNNASFLNITKSKTLTEYYNYFLGNDKAKWTGNVKAYEEILFTDIYNNIDLKLYSNSIGIKYDLIVKPHANINGVELNYKNINNIFIKDGNLVVETSIGNVIEQKPYAYQIIKGRKIEIKCEYNLKTKNTVGYNLPNGYNTNYELIIDPTIIVCSYSNSTVLSTCWGASHDKLGNIYVSGISLIGYPTTIGAFQISFDSLYDNTITKYDANGTTKVFSTYLGGSKIDLIQNVIVTNTDITVFGQTFSDNFPVTSNAYDTSYNDPIYNNTLDFYISKLSLTGSNLIASTYIGGSGNEGINVFTGNTGSSVLGVEFTGNMEIDTSGNVYVTSSSVSSNFPVTSGAFQPNKKLGIDNVAFKLNSNLSVLIYSTFFGGASNENAVYSKLVNGNELIICGTTLSPNFPVTSGVISTVKKANADMYVLHLNSLGTNIITSTFIGSSANDYAYLLDIDINNDIYVCGYTSSSSSFSATSGLYNNPNGRCTIFKLNSNLSTIVYQTKFGTQQFLQYTAFKVDSCQNIYIAGFANTNNLPVTSNKFQDYNKGSDLYIAMFYTNMLSLVFGSYFGGEHDEHTDGGTSYFSDKGVLYQGLCINKGDIPTTPGAFQTNYPSTDTTYYNDAFVKIDLQSFIKTTSSYGPEIKGCAPYTANFSSFSNTGTVSWNFGDGSPVSSQQNAIHNYIAIGEYEVYLVASDTNTCNKTDTVKSIIKIVNPTNLIITGNPKLCDDGSTLLTAETNEPVTFNWNTGAITNTVLAQSEGVFEVTTNNGGCDSKQTLELKQYYTNLNGIFPNVITPNNDAINDVIDLSKYSFTQVTFTVFDRWGSEKFKTEKSDGIFNGKNCTDGTYFYTLIYTNECNSSETKTKGFITVLN